MRTVLCGARKMGKGTSGCHVGNLGLKMVTMARRSVRADGGIGILELALCTGVRGMGLGTAAAILTPTRLTC